MNKRQAKKLRKAQEQLDKAIEDIIKTSIVINEDYIKTQEEEKVYYDEIFKNDCVPNDGDFYYTYEIYYDTHKKKYRIRKYWF